MASVERSAAGGSAAAAPTPATGETAAIVPARAGEWALTQIRQRVPEAPGALLPTCARDAISLPLHRCAAWTLVASSRKTTQTTAFQDWTRRAEQRWSWLSKCIR